MNAADGHERTFAPPGPAGGRGFAQSWWGRAWLKALEDTALDGAQLRKGRTYARKGAVGAVSVRPGRITAVVQDPDSSRCRSDVLLQQLSDQEWDSFLDMAVDRSGHIAALLDREMPPHLVEDAAAAGVDLLPGIGDLEPECSCDSWDHCPHTAALCYQVARLLDQDPFVLLLMRGRGEREILGELQARSMSRAARPGPEAHGTPADRTPADGTPSDGTAAHGSRQETVQEGVRADEAFAALSLLPPLPPLPAPPDGPGRPPSLDTASGPPPGIDPAALEFLAADAIARACALLAEAVEPDHEHRPVEAGLTPGQDAVRLAATAPEGRITARLAEGSGRDPAALALAVRAWQCGGAAALAVLEERWTPGTEALARARAQLEQAWEDGVRPGLEGERDRWTVAGAEAQLRYGRDGRWWPYRKDRGRWTPVGPGDHDPAAALAVVNDEG
ncbi:SWF or SNF family helicase [Streptomyces sp. NPDC051320]|uniref:SWIM zinc finger family protein n=1 Tax=Streptomyces sp. NPDC051320 TaxID=3154644 RepID=UPI003440C39E